MTGHNPMKELVDFDRDALIQDISDKCGVTHLDSATWACLWLADLPNLRSIVEEFATGTFVYDSATQLKAWQIPCTDTEETTERIGYSGKRPADALSSKQPKRVSKKPRVSIKEEPVASIALTKEETPEERCKKRDKAICVITHAAEPVDAVPIYPKILGTPTDRAHSRRLSDFCKWAKRFWSSDAVDRWAALICGTNDLDPCSGLITLSTHVEQLWRRGRFALMPIRPAKDRKAMRVGFFWLPQNKYADSVLLTSRPLLLDNLKEGPGHTKLFGCFRESLISSNSVTVLQTDDPVKLPLPSPELLELQWILNRVVALSGVVG
ncbi:hypothetical protein BDV18DRAFT_159413 [Aspergillus unguis]